MRRILTFLGLMFVGAATGVAQTDPLPVSQEDQLLIEVQEICPVTGKPLGSMGTPIKVKIGQQESFLCCKGCVGKDVDKQHWSKIQENIAAAQGVCPIMGKSVSSEMESTVVDGHRIFVCCPPCIEKIQGDKKGAWKKVVAGYQSHLKQKAAARSEQLHIQAQAICPVTGEKLGSMGEPVKVKVGEEVAYLCCKGCLNKKISAEHWKTVQANLAKAQGVCPIMLEPVDASMKSTVVSGRRIYVCCPPCIQKIQAQPGQALETLDQLISNGGKPVELETADTETSDK